MEKKKTYAKPVLKEKKLELGVYGDYDKKVDPPQDSSTDSHL